jgi:hypothetical protein
MLSASDPLQGLASRVLAFPSSSIYACGKWLCLTNGHPFIPGPGTAVRIHNIRNSWPTQNEFEVPSSPGRESGCEYTFLGSLTAIQLISGQFFVSFQTLVLTFLNTRSARRMAN